MEQERDSQTIFFKDLFFAILRKWVAVLLATAIGAGLLGGWKLYENILAADKNMYEQQSSEEITQREQIKQAIEVTDARIDTQRTYLTASPLMQLDPTRVYRASLAVYVHTDYQIQPGSSIQNPDSTSAILASYEQILYDGNIIKNISEETGLSSQYLHELVVCTTVNSFPGILNITITTADEETAQSLLLLVKAAMEESYATVLKQTQKDHSITIQEKAPVLRSDTLLADQQKAATQRLTDLQNQKIEWQKLQNTLTFSGDGANPLLYAAVGGAAGMLVAVIVICIMHIASNKVYSERTLKNRTGIKILGRMPACKTSEIRHKRFKKLDGRVVTDEYISVIAANIRNQHDRGENVLLIGSASPEDRVALHAALNEAQVPFVDCGDLLTEPRAFDALATCSSVVLIEKCNFSTYENIERVMEHIADQDKPLLGCVLLNG